MFLSLKSLFGLSSRFLVLPLVLMLTLSSCSSPLSLLMGGGPKVAANVQAGRTNSQTIGTTNNTEQRIVSPTVSGDILQSSDTIDVKTEKVDSVNISNTEPWMILLLILGWLLPSPNEIGRWIKDLFKRKDK
jgi:hypothetical protein